MKTFFPIIMAFVMTLLILSGCAPTATQPAPVVSEPPGATIAALPSQTVPLTEPVLPSATPQPTAAAPGPIQSVSLSLEGQTWKLVSYVDAGGVQKTPLENTTVTAIFDKGQVTGNASCNSYFAPYQQDGDKLTISNAGSTMMACLAPGVMIQEAAYLEALQRAATFKINAGQLEIVDAKGKTILVYTVYSQKIKGPVPAETQNPVAQASLSFGSLKNMDFRSGFTVSGRAPLNNGEYRETGAQGSASETTVRLVEQVAYGELPDGQVAAAVVLATNSGGSGTFYELALVVDLNGAPLNIASVFLGDRIKLNSLKFENGQVLVDMVKQGPNDPMCCPTLRVLQKYALQGAELALVSSEEIK